MGSAERQTNIHTYMHAYIQTSTHALFGKQFQEPDAHPQLQHGLVAWFTNSKNDLLAHINAFSAHG